MSWHTLHTGCRKRAAGIGLFFGMLWCVGGCEKPAFSTEVTKTPVPTVTVQPELTKIQSSGKPTQTPAATKEPEITEKLPLSSPEPSTAPLPSSVPDNTLAPAGQPSAVPTEKLPVTPKPSVKPTKLPAPTVAPVIVPTAQPGASPEPSVPPLLTPIPEYAALLQNGWQKTEDFFQTREIFFSGIFDHAEIVAATGRYEYQYTSSLKEGIGFAVIGEKDAVAQQFLDELVFEFPDCQIVEEGEEDYSYTYQREETLVTGRVYTCRNGENANRMRIEFYTSAQAEGEMEGYGFYLKPVE